MKKSHLLGFSMVFLAVSLVGAFSAVALVTYSSFGFSDNLSSYDTFLWRKANNYSNDDPFNCWFTAANVTHSGGKMILELNNTPGPPTPPPMPPPYDYACAEYQTREEGYGYGQYSASIKAAKGEGVVTAFFVYHGTWGTSDHHEIDFEILGKDTWSVHLNYFAAGVGVNGEHEVDIPLTFDASTGYHTYTFWWTRSWIQWSVDGKVVHTAQPGSPSSLPIGPVKIYANLWTGAEDFLGPLNYPGTPIQASFDKIEFYRVLPLSPP
jgi:endo-1,3-1,4-beta-glycanase ExoK